MRVAVGPEYAPGIGLLCKKALLLVIFISLSLLPFISFSLLLSGVQCSVTQRISA